MSIATDNKRFRILIVDDEVKLLASLTRLCRERCDVVTARDGGAALELLERDRAFDAVLCDMVMPGLSGAEFRERVGALVPELRARFVFMSASCPAPAPGDVLLCKPFIAEQLFAELLALSLRTHEAQVPSFLHRVPETIGRC